MAVIVRHPTAHVFLDIFSFAIVKIPMLPANGRMIAPPQGLYGVSPAIGRYYVFGNIGSNIMRPLRNTQTSICEITVIFMRGISNAFENGELN